MPTTTLPPITEREFQAQVLQLARLHRWACYHTFDSRRSQAGFPDLTLVRPPRLIFAELKRSSRQKPTAEQLAWLQKLREVPGVEVYLWTPERWAEIEEELR